MLFKPVLPIRHGCILLSNQKAGTLPLLVPDFVHTTHATATATLINPYRSQGWFIVEAYVVPMAGDTLRKQVRIGVK